MISSGVFCRLRGAVLLLASLLFLLPAFAAPPGAEVEAKIVGRWHVSPPGTERIYEISAGRNVKIMGGNLKEKFGHLAPQNEGGYTMNLEGGAVEKIVYSAASDQLFIEYYESKKNLELGLAKWKGPGVRVAAK